MAIDGRSLGINIGVNGAICLIILLAFGKYRRLPFTRRFYSPKSDVKDVRARPKALENGFWSWIWPVHSSTLNDVIRIAGMDAAMHIQILKFGLEVFVGLTLWCLIVVLPVNVAVGDQIDQLLAGTVTLVEPSNYTYWIPPPAPPQSPSPGQEDQSPAVYETPQFYSSSVPPAPPGVVWWKYNDGVPPLPNPVDVLGANFSSYGWKRDDGFQAPDTSYKFSNIDKASISNMAGGVKGLWTHAISTWVVSFFLYWMLFRYNKQAVQLRIKYLNSLKKGAESHTVLVNDVPGVRVGASKLAHKAKKEVATKLTTPKNTQRKLAVAPENVAVEVAAEQKLKGAGNPAAGTEKTAPKLDGPGNDAALESAAALMPAQNQAVADALEEDNGEDFDAKIKADRVLDSGTSPQDFVREEFEELYPHQVVSAVMVYSQSDVAKLVSQYDSAKGNLESLLDFYASRLAAKKPIKKRRTVTVVGARYGSWGIEKYGKAPRKVDAIEFNCARLQDLWERIKDAQVSARAQPLPSAFVTFSERHTQVVAASSMMHHDQRYWKVEAAPGPQELLWHNLGKLGSERSLRVFLAWALFFTIASFYLIPIAAIQAIIQVDRLEKVVVFKQLLSVSFIKGVMVAVIPGLVLTIFLALLPKLLAVINDKLQGMISQSQVDFGVVNKFFAFQVITTFLGSLLAGSFLNQITTYIDNPSGVITTLGGAAPQTATFFISFILAQAFIATPLQLLRLPGLIFYWIKLKAAATQRAKDAASAAGGLSYGSLVPNHLIIFLLGLVFCIIQPIITPFALLYFVVAGLVWRYQSLYVFIPNWESGGRLWTQVFQHCMTAMFFFQVIMIGILGIKKAPGPSVACLPLLPLSAGFLIWSRKLFTRPQVIQSMRSAADADRAQQKRALALTGAEEEHEVAAELYVSPVFKVDEKALGELLKEARQMDSCLKGEGPPPGTVQEPAAEQARPITSDVEAVAKEAAAPDAVPKQGLHNVE